MKRFSAAVGLVLAVLLLFCSCTSPLADHPLIGRWEIRVEDSAVGGSVPLVYHFKEDGKLYLEQRDGDEITFSLLSGSFEISGDTVRLSMDGNYDTFTFSVTNEQLILSREGQEDLIFLRV